MKYLLLLTVTGILIGCGSVPLPAPPPVPPTPPTEALGVNMGAGNTDGVDRNTKLSHLLADTGVKWAYVPVFWAWAEPIRGWYRFESLDATVQSLVDRDVEPVLQIRGWPSWASGSGCEIAGTENPKCAKLLNSHKESFSAALQMFSRALAIRYPDVRYWAIGNEPNLAGYFSPEPSDRNSPVSDYWEYMFSPAADGIASVNPESEFLAADLYTCYNQGSGCEQRDENWGYETNWLNDWARFLLARQSLFHIMTIHNYSSSDAGIRAAVQELQSMMRRFMAVKPVWVTEFNFKSGTCPDHSEPRQREISNLVCKTKKYQNWGRSFYFNISNNDQNCFSLLAPGDSPKDFLYPAFQTIVNNDYVCQ